jgi:hypothetical protein
MVRRGVERLKPRGALIEPQDDARIYHSFFDMIEHNLQRFVNRLPTLTPAIAINSTICRADRRSDPTPIDIRPQITRRDRRRVDTGGRFRFGRIVESSLRMTKRRW